MSVNYAAHYAKRGPTPQTQPMPGREIEQVKNNAGGFVFEVGDWAQFDRFLVLGATGSYYAGARKMTVDNAKVVERCIAEDGPRSSVAPIARFHGSTPWKRGCRSMV